MLQADYGVVIGYGTIHDSVRPKNPSPSVSSVYIVDDDIHGGYAGTKVVNMDGVRRAGHVITNGPGRYLCSPRTDAEFRDGAKPVYTSVLDDAAVFHYATPGRQSVGEDIWYRLYVQDDQVRLEDLKRLEGVH